MLITVCAAAGLLTDAMYAQGSSIFEGTILAYSSERPLANAEIVFPALKMSARSDDRGNFKISSLPSGTHEVLVRLVGYEPFNATIELQAKQADVEILLKPTVTNLASVDIKADRWNRYSSLLRDFEERRKTTAGKFLTADVFEKNVGRTLGDVLSGKLGGVRTTMGRGTKKVLTSVRGRCPVQVIVNGLVMYSGREETFDINSLITDEVIGVEYYSFATTPARFTFAGGASRCGTLLLWMK